MTSSTDTDEHPEVAEISALTEGLLSPSRTVDVRTHLATCGLCADVQTSLDEIRSTLGTLPGPVRMPDDIAGRIDAALAAEALLDATAPGDRASVSRETEDADPAGHVSRETEPAAASSTPATEGKPSPAVDRPAGRPRAATGPGRKSTPRSGAGASGGRSRRWPKVLLGSACAAAVIGIGTLFFPSGSDHDNGGPGTTAHADPSSTAKSTLSEGALKDRVQEMLADQKNTPSRGVTTQNTPDMPLRANDPVVPSCVQRGTGRSEPVLAAQQDTYDGKTAYVVVMPHRSDSSLVDAFVVDASCVSASHSSPGKLLVSRTYPRG
ncbi:hypothetical protein [Streptomyces botrytidirepellens]|uniref:Zinc-finger domain-containing protein n=1 Tax=Streptomyces botrytidirepellens TaxID=2486417 RepID=A0A3M8VVF1_9ACTN|nr:hypothetical protein [Streptomyces botrytidirepellens]RNG21187.1 hypothetical protein EEJ42_22905 [Streptomyces botrytidirepellens]